VGCIFAELLAMMRENFATMFDRQPLFPGGSCFPLSPGAAKTQIPQNSDDGSGDDKHKEDQLGKIF
jgi:mitogen-activated protein kinase 1/3